MNIIIFRKNETGRFNNRLPIARTANQIRVAIQSFGTDENT